MTTSKTTHQYTADHGPTAESRPNAHTVEASFRLAVVDAGTKRLRPSLWAAERAATRAGRHDVVSRLKHNREGALV